jgi:multiple sugar transport system substrate-binding protein
MSKKLFAVASLLVVAAIVLAACAPAPAAAPVQVVVTAPPVTVKETVVVQQTVMAPTAEPMKDRVQVYWYIGLGAGAQPAQIPVEKDWVDKYNKSQNEIQLIPIIVDNKYAADNLTAQLAAGNAPDIVGPVGAEGRAAFPGAFADLTPLVKEANYDMSDVDPAFTKFYVEEGKLVGLPFAIYPSSLFVNKDLFKEAKLDLPPQKVGDKYTLDGKQVDWDWDTVLAVAKKLTVDKSGNDATSPKFDPKNIVQYGFKMQWVDDNPRWFATYWGAAMPVAANGNATIPDFWKVGMKWYYDAIWKYHVAPTQAADSGDLLKGNAFGSGKVAMGLTHTWYTCCIDPKVIPNWDLAIVPSYQGKITAKMHADTFSITKDSKHPKEAFKVYQYMLGAGSADLYKIYGAMPARKAQQAAFWADLDKKFAPNKANWQVAVDMIPFMDIPNHQAGLGPNNNKANTAFTKFGSDIKSNPNLDMDKRITDFVAELDKILKEKPAQ